MIFSAKISNWINRVFDPVFLVCFLLSLVVFYGKEMWGVQDRSIVVGLFWEGSILLIFLLYLIEAFAAGGVILPRTMISFAVLLLLLADIFGFFIGLLRHNVPRYLIGDTVNHAMIPMVFLCTCKYINFKTEKAIKLITYSVAIVGVCYVGILLKTCNLKLYPPVILMAFAITYLLSSQHLISIMFYLGFCGITFQTILNSGRRTPFIQFLIMVFCCFGVYLIKNPKRWKRVILRGLALSVTIVLLITVFYIKDEKALAKSSKRIIKKTSLTSKEKDMSTVNRFLEVQDVISTIHSAGPVYFICGFGNGGLWTREKATTRSGNEVYENQLHHVHNLPASVFFRQGVPGLVAWIVLYSTIAIVFLRFFFKYNYSGGQNVSYYLVCLLSVSVMLLGTWVKFRIIYDPLLGLALAYISMYSDTTTTCKGMWLGFSGHKPDGVLSKEA